MKPWDDFSREELIELVEQLTEQSKTEEAQLAAAEKRAMEAEAGLAILHDAVATTDLVLIHDTLPDDPLWDVTRERVHNLLELRDEILTPRAQAVAEVLEAVKKKCATHKSPSVNLDRCYCDLCNASAKLAALDGKE